MESNYRNKEFEHYIKQNADQYRMFPSDKVWKGIDNSLHTRRKWYGFWLGSLLLLTGTAVTWVMISQPPKKDIVTIPVNKTSLSIPVDNSVSFDKTAQVIKNLNPFLKTSATPGTTLTVEPGTKEIAFPMPFEKIITDKSFNPLTISDELYIPDKDMLPRTYNLTPTRNISITEATPVAISDITIVKDIPKENASPYTIESITNSYRYNKPARKISWQVFITPTVSYRKLSVNKDNPAASNYPFSTLADVNSVVIHKPDLGLQVGLSGRYPITKNLKLRGGVQFNINRYDIKAYSFNGDWATIDLNGGNGNSSISTWTNYRNYAGYKSDWLKNYYYSISAPFGVEMTIAGKKKTNLGIAGTIQPTYILKDRAYLISTDYKNYAEVPRLIRHLNLNTSFETFVNYTNGKTKWQIGPQVRYQLLSSFHNKYPIKENLFDFGVKVGVTLNE